METKVDISNLLDYISHSIFSVNDLGDLPDDMKQYISFQFEKAFCNSLNPLKNTWTLSKPIYSEDIMERMINSFPQKNKNEP